MGPEAAALGAAAAPEIVPMALTSAAPAMSAFLPAVAPAMEMSAALPAAEMALAPSAASLVPEAAGAALPAELGATPWFNAAPGLEVPASGMPAAEMAAPQMSVAPEMAGIPSTPYTPVEGMQVTAAPAGQQLPAKGDWQTQIMDKLGEYANKYGPGVAMNVGGTMLNANAISNAEEEQRRADEEAKRRVAEEQEAIGRLVTEFGDKNLSPAGYEGHRATSEGELMKFFSDVLKPNEITGPMGKMSDDYMSKVASSTLDRAQSAADLARANAALGSHTGANTNAGIAASQLNANIAPHLTSMSGILANRKPANLSAGALLAGSAMQSLGTGMVGR